MIKTLIFNTYLMEKLKESDLAEKIINYLENKGWISYKEVSVKGKGGGIRSDSYFVKKHNDEIVETMALETKMSFSLKVIEQAEKWLTYANRSYICIPSPKRATRKTLSFGLKVCKKMNIGVFEVNMTTGIIKELNSPTIDKNTKIPPLYEQQRESVAGNDKSEYITAFKITIINMNEYMKDKEMIELKELLANIKHHYKTISSAMNAIQKMVNRKIIKGYEIKKEDKKIILFKLN